MKKKCFILALLSLLTCSVFAQSETEPNDYQGQANIIPMPASLSNDTINNINDVDWYKVYMPKAGVMLVNIPPNGNSFGFRIEIYDSASNRHDHRGNNAGLSVTSETLIPYAGWWYIKVLNGDNNNWNWSKLPYSLNVSLDTSDIFEWNNNIATARSIPMSATVQGKVRGVYEQPITSWSWDVYYDVDYYKVYTPAANNSLTASIPANLTGLNLKVQILDSNGTVLNYNTSSVGGAVSTQSTNLPAGWWYIAVSSYYDGQTSANPYTLNVNLTPTTGISEDHKNGIENILITPNPCKGKFRLTLPSEIQQNCTILITNIIGETIKQFTTSSRETELSIDALSGIYFLTATTETQKIYTKIVIDK